MLKQGLIIFLHSSQINKQVAHACILGVSLMYFRPFIIGSSKWWR